MISLREYEAKKRKLVEVVRSGKGQVALGKSTSNLFRHREQKGVRRIDVKSFNHVISVDKESLVADVEGMTTYEELVRETLRFGLLPAVVPQLKSITVGGALTGVGIESSSFRFGLVHETVQEIEVLLGGGDVIKASSKWNHDLFFGFPNSYGTLGYALRVKVKLVPAKKYVKLTHLRFSDPEDYFAVLGKICLKQRRGWEVGFVDGVIFSRNEMYLTLGEFVDRVPYVSDYTYLDIFYQSIRKKKTDYVTAHGYIWRWDTDWFWCSKHFGVQNKFVRLLVGRRWLRSTTYWKIREWSKKCPVLDFVGRLRGRRYESVVQDVEIPLKNCERFISFFHTEIGIKPVWVCPTMAHSKKVDFPLYPMDKQTLYVNFGFWDVVPTTRPDGHFNRLIERQVKALGGKKSLYSTSFYGEDEFWELYNGPAYWQLKLKYDRNAVFKDLYEKCVKRR